MLNNFLIMISEENITVSNIPNKTHAGVISLKSLQTVIMEDMVNGVQKHLITLVQQLFLSGTDQVASFRTLRR